MNGPVRKTRIVRNFFSGSSAPAPDRSEFVFSPKKPTCRTCGAPVSFASNGSTNGPLSGSSKAVGENPEPSASPPEIFRDQREEIPAATPGSAAATSGFSLNPRQTILQTFSPAAKQCPTRSTFLNLFQALWPLQAREILDLLACGRKSSRPAALSPSLNRREYPRPPFLPRPGG